MCWGVEAALRRLPRRLPRTRIHCTVREDTKSWMRWRRRNVRRSRGNHEIGTDSFYGIGGIEIEYRQIDRSDRRVTIFCLNRGYLLCSLPILFTLHRFDTPGPFLPEHRLIQKPSVGFDLEPELELSEARSGYACLCLLFFFKISLCLCSFLASRPPLFFLWEREGMVRVGWLLSLSLSFDCFLVSRITGVLLGFMMHCLDR